ncbi:hypothetical protein BH10CYA1_BH10CYA1_23190 [soil metagenome]
MLLNSLLTIVYLKPPWLCVLYDRQCTDAELYDTYFAYICVEP